MLVCSSYRIVHQCDVCKKVYTNEDKIMYGLCEKCGSIGRFNKMVGKRTLHGWKVKPYKITNGAWSEDDYS